MEKSVLDEKVIIPDEKVEIEFLCEKTGHSFDIENYIIDNVEYSKMYYETGDRVYKVNGYYEKCGYVIRKERK